MSNIRRIKKIRAIINNIRSRKKTSKDRDKKKEKERERERERETIKQGKKLNYI